MFLLAVLACLVLVSGFAYQLGFLKWSKEEVFRPAVVSSSKISQKPLSDVETAHSPSYTSSTPGGLFKGVSRAGTLSPNDLGTAKSPVFANSSAKEVKKKGQPTSDVKTATSPKLLTAVSSSSASASTGASDCGKKVSSNIIKRSKRNHSKHRSTKSSKGSKRRDKGGFSSSSNHSVTKQPKGGKI